MGYRAQPVFAPNGEVLSQFCITVVLNQVSVVSVVFFSISISILPEGKTG